MQFSRERSLFSVTVTKIYLGKYTAFFITYKQWELRTLLAMILSSLPDDCWNTRKQRDRKAPLRNLVR